MGVLRDHDLGRYTRLGYTVLAETGTGRGTAVQHAMGVQPPFRLITSCDVDVATVASLRTRWADDKRVRLWDTDSVTYIHEILSSGREADGTPEAAVLGGTLIGSDTKIVWFLDSHFPGFDLHGAAIDAEKDLDKRLPLHTELNLLVQYGRHLAGDVVLIDDLRVYERGPYAGRNMDEIGYGHAAAYDRPLPFEVWRKTHTLTRDYRDTGYAILEPIGLPR